MHFDHISNEQHLRLWLTERIFGWNCHNVRKASLDWIEPNFGSSMGISDCTISYDNISYGVELKHFKVTKNGVCYKIRPVQRRYNVMGVKAGRKLLLMASVANRFSNELVLIRGDNVPLRDYCSLLGSGCETGVIQTCVPLDGPPPFAFILETISDASWWPANARRGLLKKENTQ